MGNQVQGADTTRGGWKAYFAMCPDYWIQVREQLATQDTVLAIGGARGTIDNTAWRVPAAWHATIRGKCVSEWQVFADNKPVYEILARRDR